MQERRVRRRCRALLRELEVPAPFGPRELCRRLAEHRGRPIRLVPYPIELPGPFGLWIRTAGADLIVYQSQTPPAHQEHIILHEVGHIIAGHEGEPAEAGELPRRRRSAYDCDQEREAELIATILHEWSGRCDQLGAVAHPPQASRVAALDRIGNALSAGSGRL